VLLTIQYKSQLMVSMNLHPLLTIVMQVLVLAVQVVLVVQAELAALAVVVSN
jgi:hypothetical protein